MTIVISTFLTGCDVQPASGINPATNYEVRCVDESQVVETLKCLSQDDVSAAQLALDSFPRNPPGNLLIVCNTVSSHLPPSYDSSRHIVDTSKAAIAVLLVAVAYEKTITESRTIVGARITEGHQLAPDLIDAIFRDVRRRAANKEDLTPVLDGLATISPFSRAGTGKEMISITSAQGTASNEERDAEGYLLNAYLAGHLEYLLWMAAFDKQSLIPESQEFMLHLQELCSGTFLAKTLVESNLPSLQDELDRALAMVRSIPAGGNRENALYELGVSERRMEAMKTIHRLILADIQFRQAQIKDLK